MPPEEWTPTRLGQHFQSSRAKGTNSLPTLSVTLNDGLVRRDSLDRKMDTSLADNEHLLVKAGDIAYNMMRMWQGASGLATEDGLVSPAYVVLRSNGTIEPLFAAYLFKSPRLIYLLWAYSYGITEDRLRLYFDDFSAIPLRLPPITEQLRIAEILSTWDRAIATVESLIANARDQKQALMERLLTGKKRIPGSSGLWRELTLDNLAKVTMGSSPPSSSYNNLGEGLPLIQGNADVKNGVSVPRIHTRLITQTCLPDDILFSVRAPVGEIAISLHLACIGRGIAAIQPLSKKDAEFLYFILLFAQANWATLSQGSTFQAINSKDLRGYTFRAPVEASERQMIGRVIGEAQKAENLLRTQLTALRREKSSLMQQLLTGKRRVKL